MAERPQGLDATTIDTAPAAPIVLLGRFTVGRLIARGGMGEVYEGRDSSVDRAVAIKFLAPKYKSDPDVRLRFQREAEALGRLRHPNIVEVFAVGADEALGPFFVMQRLHGRTLAELIRADGRIVPGRVVEIGSQVLGALGHIHAAGFVHRDVKPANLMIDAGGRATLLDFGIARAEESSLTITGSAVGTPEFMSPEQARDPRLADRRSDLYSLGATLYAAWVGVPPFTGSSTYEIVNAHHTQRVKAPSAVVSSLGGAVDAFIEKALAKDPEDRFADAEAMRVALGDLAGSGKPRRAGRTLLVAAAALAALAIVAIAVVDNAETTERPAPPASPVVREVVKEETATTATIVKTHAVIAEPPKEPEPPKPASSKRLPAKREGPRSKEAAKPNPPAVDAAVPKPATIRIVTLDRGLSTYAEITIDDLPPRQSPIAEWPLPPGAHTLTARREGFHTAVVPFTLAPGERRKIEVALEPAP